MLGSNQRPPPCRGGALPAELIARGGLRLPTATLALTVVRGDVAEWLRSGLQSRLHRFDSGRRLRRRALTSFVGVVATVDHVTVVGGGDSASVGAAGQAIAAGAPHDAKLVLRSSIIRRVG